mmetsp:Transcript_21170/g.24372  ORF Transcript_21170/g.24372 Transcript_21170/m.24372 type:complete len:293 (-) Transcript_21170:72-950(-)
MPPQNNFTIPPCPIISDLSIGLQDNTSGIRSQTCIERSTITISSSALKRNHSTPAVANLTNIPVKAPPPSLKPQPPNITTKDQVRLGKVCGRLQQKYGSRTSTLIHAAKLHDKGIQFIEDGNAHNAMTLLRQAFQIRSCIHGLYHVDIAASLYNLGRVYHDREDYTTALNLYTRVLDIQTRTLKRGHVSIITTITNIGRVHHLRGDLDHALEMNKKLLIVTIEKVGKNHPFVASLYRTVGTILIEMRQLDMAMRAFAKASRITDASSDDDSAAAAALKMSRCCRRSPDAAAA